jgi:ubiquinone/menaquinone biosynthesis C-methylase UbiE
MKVRTFLLSGVLGLAAIVLAVLVFRWASRRTSLPCPSWLAGTLEGPLNDRIIGTNATLDRIGFRPGERVLEVGPGPGRLLVPAARRVLPGGEVVGLDIQPEMVRKLTARAEREGVTNLSAAVGNAEQPHFAPETFDRVYLCTVLGEIPDRQAALRECYAALKPGGVLSITELLPDPHFQTPATVRRLAEDAGFRLLERRGTWRFFTMNFAKPGNGGSRG